MKRASRHSQGFTLMETLTVVALIVIIMAFVAPIASGLNSNIKMNQLDSAAKQIYMAAQSQLTTLQTSGQRSAMQGAVEVDARKLGMPSDYPDTSVDWSKYGLYYVTDSDAATSKYIITEDAALAVSGLSGSFIIELSPSTTEVYGVFYSESDDLTYDQVKALTSRSRADRTAAGIGYYGGNALSRLIKADEITFGDLTYQLVNDEELYVKLTSNDLSLKTFDQNKLTITMTVNGYKDWNKATWTQTYQGGSTGTGGFVISPGDDEIDIVLDSMRSGMSFAELTGGNLTPGTDVSVSIGIYYDNVELVTTGVQTTNSLFESYTYNADEQTGTAAKTAKIACLRHLYNLNAARESENWEFPVSNAVMTDDIDFDGTTWNPNSVSAGSRSAGAAGNGYNPLASLVPIRLTSTLNNGSGSNIIDGAGHALKNFIIGTKGAEVDDTGVFATLACSVRGVDIVDAKVYGADRTGALAGYIGNGAGTVSDCHVYVTKTDDAGNYLYGTYKVIGYSTPDNSYGMDIGGLIGYCADGAMKDCSASVDVEGGGNVGGLVGSTYGGFTIDGSGAYSVHPDIGETDMRVPFVNGHYYNIGGLVGYLSGGDVTNSFAAVDVDCDNTDWPDATGGFVGITTGGKTISSCYSSGDVTCSGSLAGGFAGYLKRDAENCYTTSDVWCDDKAGGFAGQIAWVSLTSDVSYGQVLKLDGSVDVGSGKNSQGFIGIVPGYFDRYSDCAYLSVTGYNDEFTNVGQPGAKSYSDLAVGGLSVDDSHPYATRLQGDAFPFAPISSIGSHYGDWPSAVHVTWERGDGIVLQEEDDVYGSTPVYTGTVTLDYVTGGLFYHRSTGSWSPDVGPVKQDTTYHAQYIDTLYPSVDAILNGGVDSKAESISSLWTYINGKSNTASSGKAKSNFSCDSEAVWTSGLANAATAVNRYLVGQGICNDDRTQSYSWRISVKNGTYDTKDTLITEKPTFGTQGPSKYEGYLVIFFGEKIPAYPISSPSSVSLSVVEYDAGRASVGLPAYRYGTIGIYKPNNQNYYAYSDSTFTATSDWFGL